MRGFIVVLVLCGIYSTHSASVGFSKTSPCANRADGSFMPVIDDCSGFYMCLKGETIRSSCGSTLHFDPVGKQCVEISRSLCVSGNQLIGLESKKDQAVVEVEVRPQHVELKPLETESKAQPKQVALKPVAQPQPEEVKLEQVPLKPVAQPQPEEVKLQQVPLKPVAQPQPEEVKLEQVPLKPVARPQPEEVKLEQVPLKPVAQPQPTELKPETKPQPEEETLMQVNPQSKPVEPEHVASMAQPEEPKPQQAVALKDACLGKTVGSFVASRTNCHDYYVCLGNRMILKTCPNELHFNPDARSCTVPELANCVAESQEIPAEEKPQELIQPEANVEVEEIPAEKKPEEEQETAEAMCSGKPNGAMLPIPGSCTKFLACLQQDTYELSCGVRHFDPVLSACVLAEESGCVEVEVVSTLDAVVEVAEPLAGVVGDTTVGNGNDGVLVGNADVLITNTGSVSNANLVSASNNVAAGNTDLGYNNQYQVSGNSSSGQNKSMEVQVGFEHTASLNQVVIKDQSVGNTNLGENNSGLTVANANVNINNTGVVSNANIVLASQNVEVGNTDLGSSNTYTVSGGNLLVNDMVVPIKQSGLPLNKKQISHIDQLDIDVSGSGVIVSADGLTEYYTTVASVDAVQANKGIAIENANVKIDNSGVLSDVNVVSGTQNSVVGNTNLGSDNLVAANGLSISGDVEKENKAVVVAVVDETSTRMCVGVPSGTLFPRIGNCEEFLTCESDLSYVATCPDGLHFNALLKACDWPENAGCV